MAAEAGVSPSSTTAATPDGACLGIGGARGGDEGRARTRVTFVEGAGKGGASGSLGIGSASSSGAPPPKEPRQKRLSSFRRFFSAGSSLFAGSTIAQVSVECSERKGCRSC
mmetsp:Transcript_180334/g.572410  ORF Transcript_180334/g.572410 Transcript_180334/m.572410 type:complete len:111 (+) Transcript_180334:198-530(+)